MHPSASGTCSAASSSSSRILEAFDSAQRTSTSFSFFNVAIPLSRKVCRVVKSLCARLTVTLTLIIALPAAAASQAATLTSMSTTTLPPGAQMTLTGSGFGATQGSGSVGLQNTTATIVSWSDTQIVVTVPTGTIAGKAYVYQYGVYSNEPSFTIGATTAFAPTIGTMASLVYGQTATQLTSGQVLIAGGMTSSGVTNSAEIYSLTGP